MESGYLQQEDATQKTIRFEEILNEIGQLHALMDIDKEASFLSYLDQLEVSTEFGL